MADEHQARVARGLASERGARLDGYLRTRGQRPAPEVLLPLMELGKLVIQLKLDYTGVISGILGRWRRPCCSALGDLAAPPGRILGTVIVTGRRW